LVFSSWDSSFWLSEFRNLSSHTRPDEPCLRNEISDLCNPAIKPSLSSLSLSRSFFLC
jgi:hypothetical protein